MSTVRQLTALVTSTVQLACAGAATQGRLNCRTRAQATRAAAGAATELLKRRYHWLGSTTRGLTTEVVTRLTTKACRTVVSSTRLLNGSRADSILGRVPATGARGTAHRPDPLSIKAASQPEVASSGPTMAGGIAATARPADGSSVVAALPARCEGVRLVAVAGTATEAPPKAGLVVGGYSASSSTPSSTLFTAARLVTAVTALRAPERCRTNRRSTV